MSNILKNRSFLWVILVVGVILRIGCILTLDQQVQWEDEQDYLQLSQHIIAGEGYVDAGGHPTAFRPVGYPLFLAGLRILLPDHLIWYRLAQVVFSVLLIVLVYGIARFMFTESVALLAAFWTAGYPYFVFLPASILPTVWFSFLLLLATLMLFYGQKKNKLFYFALSAALFGFSILTRPSGIVLYVGALLWIVWMNRERWIYGLTIINVMSLVVLLVCGPWVLRNYEKLHLMALSTNAGRNLWLGNNPRAGLQTGSNIEMPKDLQLKIEATSSEVERDRIYKQEARKFILQHPERFILRATGKAIMFWRLDPSPTTGGYVRSNGTVRFIGILSFAPTLLFGILGFIMAPGKRLPYLSLWLIYAIFFTLLHALFIVKVRFRLPLDHFFIIAASYAVVRLAAVSHSHFGIRITEFIKTSTQKPRWNFIFAGIWLLFSKK